MKRVACVHLALASIFLFAEAAVVTQRQASIVTRKKQPARLDCQVTGTDFRRAVVHWYRHTDGGAPRWLLSSSPTKIEYDSSIESSRVVAERDSAGGHCTLIIHWAEFSDQGAYMCAIWKVRGATIKVFGAGTKLIVSETPAKQPDVSVFRASKDRVACVAYGFFPDVIKFEWKKKVGGKTIDLQGEKDEQLDLPITKIEDGSDKYSATSLLIYKGGNPSFKFVCVVNHEGFTNPAEFIEAIPDGPATSSGRVPAEGDLETDNCKAPYAEGLDFQPFNVATLSYTLFILKSVVYCAVVVYLTYQNKSV